MSVFRCFTLWDLERQFFFVFIRRGFDLNPSWTTQRQEIEKKLLEQIKTPEESFEMKLEYGIVRAKFDKANKCYFILLSNEKAEGVFVNMVLTEIYDIFQKVPKYVKLRKDIIDEMKLKEITQLLEKREKEYEGIHGQQEMLVMPVIQKKGEKRFAPPQKADAKPQPPQRNQSAVVIPSSQKVSSINQINEDDLARPFRCFIAYDYGREFFWIFIRRGFPLDKTWNLERLTLEGKIKEFSKKPEENTNYETDFGTYRLKYDTKAKCCFILLSRKKINEKECVDVLKEISEVIMAVKDYTKKKKDDVEQIVLKPAEAIIVKHEQLFEKENEASQVQKRQMIREQSFKLRDQSPLSVDPKQQSIFAKSAVMGSGQSIQFNVRQNSRIQSVPVGFVIPNDYKVCEFVERMQTYRINSNTCIGLCFPTTQLEKRVDPDFMNYNQNDKQ
ncbi:hypothetical protein pb186bvf_005503 [Paramecium bursaria]